TLGAGKATVSAATATSITNFKITFPNTVGTAGVPLLVVANNSLTGGTTPSVSVSLLTSVLQYSSTYAGAHSGDPLTAGLVDEGGAISGVSQTGGDSLEVFSVPMRATAAGTITFATDPADDSPNHDVLEYGDAGSNGVVPRS